MKKTKLIHPELGVTEFEAEHAKRILGMKRNGGWELYTEEKKADEKSNSKESNSDSGNIRKS